MVDAKDWNEVASKRPWPRPPWLDVGDRVRVRESGLPGVVLRADHYLVGMVYEVAHLDGVTPFLRDDLDFERAP